MRIKNEVLSEVISMAEQVNHPEPYTWGNIGNPGRKGHPEMGVTYDGKRHTIDVTIWPNGSDPISNLRHCMELTPEDGFQSEKYEELWALAAPLIDKGMTMRIEAEMDAEDEAVAE